MSSLSSSSFSNPASRLAFCLFLGSAASLGVFGVLKTVEGVLSSDKFQVIPSPKVSHLSKKEKEKLPYPPDALPGARDVDSPYGPFRVYEWGPEDGPRVLLIHGISTPSIALAGLASKLVEKGCRVMLFDLFGRGHSSAPSPHLHPYDSSLYTSQVLLALQSSPLSTWKPFTLIGYSLGGGLAADFTSYFPFSVSNLFLIAPGGLIRPSHITWKSKLLYDTEGLIPESLVQNMVGRRLWTPDAEANTPSSTASVVQTPQYWNHKNTMDPELELEAEAALGAKAEKAEAGDASPRGGLRTRAVYTSSAHQLLPSNPYSTVGAVVNWQIAHHPGFVPAFISSIRNAPIHGQQARWEKIGEYLQARASQAAEEEGDGEKIEKEGDLEGLREVHIVLGAKDPIIIAEELVPDAEAVLGKEFLRVHSFDTGHEVAIENAVEIAELVAQTLGL